MFQRQLNQIRIDLSITPRGPLAIRSGRTGADPTRPDLECVRTTVDGQPSVYIPGSSLKGVMRAHAERLLQSIDLSITSTFDPAARRKFQQSSPGPEVHRGTCPLGRTFGTLHLKGRLAVSDLLPGGREPASSKARQRQQELANSVEQRNGVAIDRLLGSVSGGALYDQEAVVQGRFDGQLVMRNAQLYQLALVLFVLRDLDEGYLTLGSSSSRGFGRVAAKVEGIQLEVLRGRSQGGSQEGDLPGAGALAGEGGADYDLFRDDTLTLPAEIGKTRRMLWDHFEVPAARVDALAEALVDGPWSAFLGQARGKSWAA